MEKKIVKQDGIRSSEWFLAGIVLVSLALLALTVKENHRLTRQVTHKQKELDGLKSQLVSIKHDVEAANKKLTSISAEPSEITPTPVPTHTP